MFLKKRILSLVMILNQAVLAQERVEIAGPFIVCSEGHFAHKLCPGYKSSVAICPTCRDENLVEVKTAFFSLGNKDKCVVCLERHIPKLLFKSGLAK